MVSRKDRLTLFFLRPDIKTLTLAVLCNHRNLLSEKCEEKKLKAQLSDTIRNKLHIYIMKIFTPLNEQFTQKSIEK